MRWSLRLLVSFALLAGLALPGAAQPTPPPPTTSPANLQRLLDILVATGAPGAIGGVEDDGHTIRGVSGVGNLSSGQPPRPVQTFRVASQTKVFVATAALQLVARGRVGLDDRWAGTCPGGCCPTATRSPCASSSTTPAACTTPRSRSTRPSRTSSTSASSTGPHAR